LLGQPHAFRQAAGGMADLQAQVPQHVENKFDDAFAPGRLLEGAHEQKIDIRARRQFAAAIAAGSNDGQTFGGRGVLRVIDMLDGEIVDHLDQCILQHRQGAGRFQPGQPLMLHRLLHRGAARLKRCFDERETILAQGAGIGRLSCQCGQGMTQRVGIDQCRQLQFRDGLFQSHQCPFVATGMGGRGSGPWVRITTPQAMRAPDSPMG